MGPRMNMNQMLTNFPGTREIRDQMRGLQPLMSTDIVEGANDFHVCCDLPGVNMEDLNVEVRGEKLVITGERKTMHELEDFRSHRVERASGKITRTIPIPQGACHDNVDTTFNNGVLTVSFKKSADFKQVKKLDIKTG